MKALSFFLAAFGLAGAIVADSRIVADEAVRAEQLERGRKAALELGKSLRKRLEETIASQGATAAITVCNAEAVEIAERVSERVNAQVRRTALRVRNPSNAPDEASLRVLEEFSRQLAAGTPAAQLEHIEANDRSDGSREIRYWKAIPMEPVCAMCHGESIPAELDEIILSKYPADQARGFQIGEIRGAFDVQWTEANPRRETQ